MIYDFLGGYLNQLFEERLVVAHASCTHEKGVPCEEPKVPFPNPIKQKVKECKEKNESRLFYKVFNK
jgi:hypothetical protein